MFGGSLEGLRSLGNSLEVFCSSGESLGNVFESFWGFLGTFGKLWEVFWRHRGGLWSVLGTSWRGIVSWTCTHAHTHMFFFNKVKTPACHLQLVISRSCRMLNYKPLMLNSTIFWMTPYVCCPHDVSKSLTASWNESRFSLSCMCLCWSLRVCRHRLLQRLIWRIFISLLSPSRLKSSYSLLQGWHSVLFSFGFPADAGSRRSKAARTWPQ